jgi:hypothetical protein
LKSAIKQSIRAYARDIEQARFLDMSQSFSLKVPLLRKIFPDAYFIVQTRNPYAVCLRSACDYRYEWVRRMGDSETLQRLRLKIFAEHWRNTFTCAMGDLKGDEHKILVRYEDLVEQPEQELQRIAEAVDLEYIPDMIPREDHTLPLGSGERHKWFPIRTGTNRKYLRKLDGDMASVIKKIVGDVATRFDYHPPDW